MVWSCHLIPKFGTKVGCTWDAENILDFLNIWTNQLHLHHAIDFLWLSLPLLPFTLYYWLYCCLFLHLLGIYKYVHIMVSQKRWWRSWTHLWTISLNRSHRWIVEACYLWRYQVCHKVLECQGKVDLSLLFPLHICISLYSYTTCINHCFLYQVWHYVETSIFGNVE